MNKTIIAIISFIIGFLLCVLLISFFLAQLNENTITFQTDSPWFSDCKGENSPDFVFIFGTLDCEDLGLEEFVNNKTKGEKAK